MKSISWMPTPEATNFLPARGRRGEAVGVGSILE
jgi:hypothetical protein